MRIGDVILGYTVDEEIGSGGFGTVYKVSKSNVSGTYTRALKHIKIPTNKQYVDILNSMGGDYSKADDYFAGVLREITGEIQIISRLTESGAQNIVRYYENDITETESPKTYDIYILMEYLEPFTSYFYRSEFTVGDVIKLGKDILSALISCHANKIIHRDIKDDNIFVSADGLYKLGDFGVSKVLKDRSRAESMKGTPNYIAPEVYLGKEKYDNTVDLYSLGIVLYKLLNKSRFPFLPSYPNPYNSNDEDVAFEKRMSGEVPELPSDANSILGKVVIKAINTREQRYNSAEEFLAALCEAELKLTDDEKNYIISKQIPQSKIEYDVTGQSVNVHKNEKTGATVGSDMSTSTMNQTVADETKKNYFDTFDNTDSNKSRNDSQTSQRAFHGQITVAENTPKQSNITMDFHDRTVPQEAPQVRGIEKNQLKWLIYLAPVVIALIYIIIYMVIIPNKYESAVSIIEWLIKNPLSIVEKLRNPYTILTPIYKVYAFKILNWVLWAAFITSLYFVGRTIQNKKPEVNTNAVMTGKDPYLRTIEIVEMMKQFELPAAKQAAVSVKRVNERLKNESDFGSGNNSVINCENEISSLLDDIEGNLQGLSSEETCQSASSNITMCCQKIQAKLRLRTELKKK